MSPAAISLRRRCHVNTNREGDCFVGIKIVDGEPTVHFPIGYSLSDDDESVRKDIFSLLLVLQKYGKQQGVTEAASLSSNFKETIFPINVCIELLRDFMERGGYYSEREYEFHRDNRGRVNWAKTVKKIMPLPGSLQKNGPIYTEFIVKHASPSEKNLITQIHKYCVYESFRFLGWLFTTYVPDKVAIKYNKPLFLSIITAKIHSINNDRDKRLMMLLKMFVEKHDFTTNKIISAYGTNNFEYIWEKLIDNVFGIKNKQDYFPKTLWRLKYGDEKTNVPLEPDTIMQLGDCLYVLDAKYYKFGVTGRALDLPQSASINKQITYGEYVATHFFENITPTQIPVYNAFIMPFDAKKNPFGRNSVIENIGEAVGAWKESRHIKYERVQGILFDTKSMIHYSVYRDKNIINMLATAIEGGFCP